MPLPLLPIALGGLSFLGGLFGNKNKQTSTPNHGPLQDRILQIMRQRLGSSADLSGYRAQGLQDTNQTFDLIRQSQSNDLTARGLGTSPVAANVDAMRENSRGGAIARFQQGLPLLQRQLQADDLGLAGYLFRGNTTEGTSGGGLGGGFDSLATMLGFLQATGAFGKGGGGGTRSMGWGLPNMSNWG